MADESQQIALNTAFAPPPPLWKHFTSDNIDKLDQIKAEAAKGDDGRPNKRKQWSAAELRALELPAELRYLVPPDIPDGQYSVYSELQAVRSSIEL
jgi:mediator of RNA polymerase II transcription subunit 7